MKKIDKNTYITPPKGEFKILFYKEVAPHWEAETFMDVKELTDVVKLMFDAEMGFNMALKKYTEEYKEAYVVTEGDNIASVVGRKTASLIGD